MATLGNLIVNITGNTAGLQNSLNRGLSQVGTFAQGVRGKFGSMAGALAPVAAAVTTTFAAGKSIAAARTQIQAEQKLAAVLKATQGAAGLSAREIGAYAAELQGLTNFGDEATIGAASVLATFKEIKGDVFKDALASAQDMSTIMGQDLQSSVVQLGKALNDPIRGVSALSEVGVSFNAQQREQIRLMQQSGDVMGAQRIILSELQSEFGGAAQALADPWTQMNNTIGDVGENIGTVLLPSLNVAAQAIGGMFGQVAGGSDAFRAVGVEMGAFFENLGLFFEFAGTKAAAKFYEIDAIAEHYLMGAIPAYLTWLKDEWFHIFQDMTNFQNTVVGNAIRNIGATWDWLLAKIKGSPIELNTRDLTEGFKSSIRTLPQLPERALSDMEVELNAMADELEGRLGQSLFESQERLGKVYNPVTMPTIPALARTPFDPTSTTSPITVPDLNTLQQQQSQGSRGPEFATALRKGSSEALSALQRASNPNRKLETLSEKQLKQLEQLNKKFSAGSFPTPQTSETLDFA